MSPCVARNQSVVQTARALSSTKRHATPRIDHFDQYAVDFDHRCRERSAFCTCAEHLCKLFDPQRRMPADARRMHIRIFLHAYRNIFGCDACPSKECMAERIRSLCMFRPLRRYSHTYVHTYIHAVNPAAASWYTHTHVHTYTHVMIHAYMRRRMLRKSWYACRLS